MHRAAGMVILSGLLLTIVSCRHAPQHAVSASEQKIDLDLQNIDRDGLRGPAEGKVAVSYEFAIPNTEEFKAQVKAIDSTVEFMPGSPGRVRAPSNACLCIGSTHQHDYRAVLNRLAALPYVERIVECRFE